MGQCEPYRFVNLLMIIVFSLLSKSIWLLTKSWCSFRWKELLWWRQKNSWDINHGLPSWRRAWGNYTFSSSLNKLYACLVVNRGRLKAKPRRKAIPRGEKKENKKKKNPFPFIFQKNFNFDHLKSSILWSCTPQKFNFLL